MGPTQGLPLGREGGRECPDQSSNPGNTYSCQPDGLIGAPVARIADFKPFPGEFWHQNAPKCPNNDTRPGLAGTDPGTPLGEGGAEDGTLPEPPAAGCLPARFLIMERVGPIRLAERCDFEGGCFDLHGQKRSIRRPVAHHAENAYVRAAATLPLIFALKGHVRDGRVEWLLPLLAPPPDARGGAGDSGPGRRRISHTVAQQPNSGRRGLCKAVLGRAYFGATEGVSLMWVGVVSRVHVRSARFCQPDAKNELKWGPGQPLES
eukprot:gene24415-biopygen14948